MSDTAFQRPDWSNPAEYEHLMKLPPGPQLAWEFLRRNPAYQSDWVAYSDECTAWQNMHLCQELTGLGLPPARFFAWCRVFQGKWDLQMPVAPSRDYVEEDPLGGAVPFMVEEFDNIDAYSRADGHADNTGSKVLIPVNLELPMTMIMAKLKRVVAGLREDGIRNGKVSPITSRVLKPRLYVQELRALDADAAGLLPHEFSVGLLGDLENRNKTARDRLVSGKKTMRSGYRLFISV